VASCNPFSQHGRRPAAGARPLRLPRRPPSSAATWTTRSWWPARLLYLPVFDKVRPVRGRRTATPGQGYGEGDRLVIFCFALPTDFDLSFLWSGEDANLSKSWRFFAATEMATFPGLYRAVVSTVNHRARHNQLHRKVLLLPFPDSAVFPRIADKVMNRCVPGNQVTI